MTESSEFTPQQEFDFEGSSLPIQYIETQDVKEGVVCDVYTFEGGSDKDLAIIRIKPGAKTPLQRILQGEKTVEGYISGKGRLVITRNSGKEEVFEVSDKKPFSTTAMIRDIMQWHADSDSDLVAYEVCIPPYQDGRFENIS